MSVRLSEREQTELDALREKKYEITPEDVIAIARAKSSALHGRFTWDTTEAARKWNLYEARKLIASYKIVIEKRPDTHVRVNVRKFESPVEQRGRGGGYVEPSADQIRAIALREIRGWETRMRDLLGMLGADPDTCAPAFDVLRTCIDRSGDQAAE